MIKVEVKDLDDNLLDVNVKVLFSNDGIELEIPEEDMGELEGVDEIEIEFVRKGFLNSRVVTNTIYADREGDKFIVKKFHNK